MQKILANSSQPEGLDLLHNKCSASRSKGTNQEGRKLKGCLNQMQPWVSHWLDTFFSQNGPMEMWIKSLKICAKYYCIFMWNSFKTIQRKIAIMRNWEVMILIVVFASWLQCSRLAKFVIKIVHKDQRMKFDQIIY